MDVERRAKTTDPRWTMHLDGSRQLWDFSSSEKLATSCLKQGREKATLSCWNVCPEGKVVTPTFGRLLQSTLFTRPLIKGSSESEVVMPLATCQVHLASFTKFTIKAHTPHPQRGLCQSKGAATGKVPRQDSPSHSP